MGNGRGRESLPPRLVVQTLSAVKLSQKDEAILAHGGLQIMSLLKR